MDRNVSVTTKKIGKVTYEIHSCLNPAAKISLEQKLQNLISRESEKILVG